MAGTGGGGAVLVVGFIIVTNLWSVALGRADIATVVDAVMVVGSLPAASSRLRVVRTVSLLVGRTNACRPALDCTSRSFPVAAGGSSISTLSDGAFDVVECVERWLGRGVTGSRPLTACTSLGTSGWYSPSVYETLSHRVAKCVRHVTVHNIISNP